MRIDLAEHRVVLEERRHRAAGSRHRPAGVDRVAEVAGVAEIVSGRHRRRVRGGEGREDRVAVGERHAFARQRRDVGRGLVVDRARPQAVGDEDHDVVRRGGRRGRRLGCRRTGQDQAGNEEFTAHEGLPEGKPDWIVALRQPCDACRGAKPRCPPAHRSHVRRCQQRSPGDPAKTLGSPAWTTRLQRPNPRFARSGFRSASPTCWQRPCCSPAPAPRRSGWWQPIRSGKSCSRARRRRSSARASPSCRSPGLPFSAPSVSAPTRCAACRRRAPRRSC